MKCPYCGTDNPPGEEFCVNCGGALNAFLPLEPVFLPIQLHQTWRY